MALSSLTNTDFDEIAGVLRNHLERGMTDELPNFALALSTVFEVSGATGFDTNTFLMGAGVLPDA